MLEIPRTTKVLPLPSFRALIKQLWWVGLLALGSLTFSLGMFALQVRNDEEQISGRVVTVSTSTMQIVDAHGRQTNVLIASSTTIHGRTEILAPGQFVYTFGKRTGLGEFTSTDIQIIEQRRPSKNLPQ